MRFFIAALVIILVGPVRAEPIAPADIAISDGDTIRAHGKTYRLVGFDTPIAETTKVYREMRDDKLDHAQGRSLVWVLSQLRAMVETQALERLEQRLEELAPSIEARNGHTFANRSARTAH